MKKFKWDNCNTSFRGFNKLEDLIWENYPAKQLIAEVKDSPDSFTEDEQYIAGLYDHFKEEINARCNEATAKFIIGNERPRKILLQKTQLEVAIRSASRDFYNEYEDVITLNPNKRMCVLISYTPYWDSFDAQDMDPGSHKTLADCIAHTYTGGDFLASQRRDDDGQREKNFIMDPTDAHVLYSHYKSEFKRYATRNNLEVPDRCGGDEDWLDFCNGLFTETVTRLFVKHRKALIHAPTVPLSRAIKLYENSRTGGR